MSLKKKKARCRVSCLHAYPCIHAFVQMSAYIHTVIHTYRQAVTSGSGMPCLLLTYIYIHTYIHTFIHTFIHTGSIIYIHTDIQTYIHTFIHTYRQ